jgi:hypothetical protein
MAKWIQQEMVRVKWMDRIEFMKKEIEEMETKNQEFADTIRPWYNQVVNQDEQLDALLESKKKEAEDLAAHLASIQSVLAGRKKAPVAVTVAFPEGKVKTLLGCFPKLEAEHPFSPCPLKEGQCISAWKTSVREAHIQRTLELVNHKKMLDQFWAHLYRLLASQIYPLLEQKSKSLLEMDTLTLNLETEIMNLKLAHPCIRFEQQKSSSGKDVVVVQQKKKKMLMPPGAVKQQKQEHKPKQLKQKIQEALMHQTQVDLGGWLPQQQQKQRQVVMDPRQSGIIIIRSKNTQQKPKQSPQIDLGGWEQE